MNTPKDMPTPADQPGLHPTHIMVDDMTGAFIADNQVQILLGEDNELLALRLYPPAHITDASAYWEQAAEALSPQEA